MRDWGDGRLGRDAPDDGILGISPWTSPRRCRPPVHARSRRGSTARTDSSGSRCSPRSGPAVRGSWPCCSRRDGWALFLAHEPVLVLLGRRGERLRTERRPRAMVGGSALPHGARRRARRRSVRPRIHRSALGGRPAGRPRRGVRHDGCARSGTVAGRRGTGSARPGGGVVSRCHRRWTHARRRATSMVSRLLPVLLALAIALGLRRVGTNQGFGSWASARPGPACHRRGLAGARAPHADGPAARGMDGGGRGSPHRGGAHRRGAEGMKRKVCARRGRWAEISSLRRIAAAIRLSRRGGAPCTSTCSFPPTG